MVSGATKVGSIRRARVVRTPGVVRNGGPAVASGAQVPIVALPAAGKAANGAASGAVGPIPTIVAVSSGAGLLPMIVAVFGVVASTPTSGVVFDVAGRIAAIRAVFGVVVPTPMSAGSGVDPIGRGRTIAVVSAGPESGANPVGRVRAGVRIGGIGIAHRAGTAAGPVVRTRVVPTARAQVRAERVTVRAVTTVARAAMIAGAPRVRSRTIVAGRNRGAVRIARTALTAAAGRAVTGRVAIAISARTVAVAGKVRNSRPADVAEIAGHHVRMSPRSRRMCRPPTWIRASAAIC